MYSLIVSTSGTRWTLRAIDTSDRDRLFLWRNDDRIRERMLNAEVITEDEHALWFTRVLASREWLATIFEIDGEPVGTIQLGPIDAPNEQAPWGFYLKPGYVLPGSGSRMGFMMLDYAFEELGLHRVKAIVLANNEPSLRMHRALGFIDEGYQRDFIRRGDTWLDVTLFGCLREDFARSREIALEKHFGNVLR